MKLSLEKLVNTAVYLCLLIQSGRVLSIACQDVSAGPLLEDLIQSEWVVASTGETDFRDKGSMKLGRMWIQIRFPSVHSISGLSLCTE